MCPYIGTDISLLFLALKIYNTWVLINAKDCAIPCLACTNKHQLPQDYSSGWLERTYLSASVTVLIFIFPETPLRCPQTIPLIHSRQSVNSLFWHARGSTSFHFFFFFVLTFRRISPMLKKRKQVVKIRSRWPKRTNRLNFFFLFFVQVLIWANGWYIIIFTLIFLNALGARPKVYSYFQRSYKSV